MGRRSISVAVLGASAKPERYSNKALKMLDAMGYPAYPVHPALDDIDGIRVYHNLADAPHADTVTMYVSPELSTKLADEIIAARPRRVIFNPGSENPTLESSLADAGIHVLRACTLVLLTTGQFEDCPA